MKKSLGKIFLLFILLQTVIYAQELAKYKLYANKTEVYTKEAVKLTFTAQQTDHSVVMFFFVEPKKSANYKIQLLTKSNKDNGYHNSSVIFQYILFPLKSENIDINFDFKVKISSDKGVAQAYIADHDESKGIEGKTTSIEVNPISIKVKALPKDIDLVGDFKLKSTVDKKEINQYDNINLHYILYGTGYDSKIKFLKQIKGVNIFQANDNAKTKLSKDGYTINRDYIYSLSAKNSFTIPAQTLKAYSPKQNRFYTLKTPSYNIKVKKIDISTILDKDESPSSKSLISTDTIKQFFIYIFLFLSGYLVAKLQSKRYKKEKDIRFKDIKDSSNAKELMMILLNNYKNEDTYNFISELEKVVYKKSNRSFKDIKKLILKKFRN